MPAFFPSKTSPRHSLQNSRRGLLRCCFFSFSAPFGATQSRSSCPEVAHLKTNLTHSLSLSLSRRYNARSLSCRTESASSSSWPNLLRFLLADLLQCLFRSTTPPRSRSRPEHPKHRHDAARSLETLSRNTIARRTTLVLKDACPCRGLSLCSRYFCFGANKKKENSSSLESEKRFLPRILVFARSTTPANQSRK